MSDVADSRRLRIYVAAPRALAGRANAFAKDLRANGQEVVSRWHVDGEPIVDPKSSDFRQKVLFENTVDLCQCDVLVALMDSGNPRATYCEIGYALAMEKHVIWISESGNDDLACIYDSHPKVKKMPRESHALRELALVSDVNTLTREQRHASEVTDALFRMFLMKVEGRMAEYMDRIHGLEVSLATELVSGSVSDAAGVVSSEQQIYSMHPRTYISHATDIVAGTTVLACIERSVAEEQEKESRKASENNTKLN